jgi:hypothetical protein
MPSSKPSKSVGRRDFLRVLGAAAGTVATVREPLVTEAAADTKSKDERKKSRYQANSPEVVTYYRVNRYPAK